MKKLVPLILLAMLLSACPDSKIPKPPPKVPEPKLVPTTLDGAPARLALALDVAVTALRHS